MTSHVLANILLKMPDLPIACEDGSEEMQEIIKVDERDGPYYDEDFFFVEKGRFIRLLS